MNKKQYALLSVVFLIVIGILILRYTNKSEFIDAVIAGNSTAVKNSFGFGVDVENEMPSGDRPIIYSIKKGNIQVVKLLLDRQGVDTSDCFQEALRTKNEKIILLMLKRRPRENRIHLKNVVTENNVEATAILLKAGGDPNLEIEDFSIHTMESNKISLLTKAIQNNSVRMVDLLLSQKANPNYICKEKVKNNTGFGYLYFFETTFLQAIRKGNDSIVKSLLKHGVNPTLNDKDGKKALESANSREMTLTLMKAFKSVPEIALAAIE